MPTVSVAELGVGSTYDTCHPGLMTYEGPITIYKPSIDLHNLGHYSEVKSASDETGMIEASTKDTLGTRVDSKFPQCLDGQKFWISKTVDGDGHSFSSCDRSFQETYGCVVDCDNEMAQGIMTFVNDEQNKDKQHPIKGKLRMQLAHPDPVTCKITEGSANITGVLGNIMGTKCGYGPIGPNRFFSIENFKLKSVSGDASGMSETEKYETVDTFFQHALRKQSFLAMERDKDENSRYPITRNPEVPHSEVFSNDQFLIDCESKALLEPDNIGKEVDLTLYWRPRTDRDPSRPSDDDECFRRNDRGDGAESPSETRALVL